jgi:hypothetical protein
LRISQRFDRNAIPAMSATDSEHSLFVGEARPLYVTVSAPCIGIGAAAVIAVSA